MNPFSLYNYFNTENISFKRGSLVFICSSADQGKSVAINSLILNYVRHGIDVLVFSENPEIRYKIMDTILDMRINPMVGEMYYATMMFYKPVECFLNTFREFLSIGNHHKGNFAIIFDGPMFGAEKSSFDFFNLNSNTRRVIVEKFTNKAQLLDLKYEVYEEMTVREKKKLRNLSFKNLASHFNSHIVVTEQYGLTFEINNIAIGDMAFNIRKNAQHNFELSCIKNRFGNDGNIIECELNRDNLSLDTCIIQ